MVIKDRLIRLRIIKAAINRFIPHLLKLVPREDPLNTASRITDDVYKELQPFILSMRDDDIVPVDDNIVQLSEATRNALVYISNHDNFYEKLLEIAYSFVYFHRKEELE